MAITFMNVSHKNAQINEFSAFSSQYFCTAGFFKLKFRRFKIFPCVCNNQWKYFKSHNFIFLACRVSVLLKIIYTLNVIEIRINAPNA